MLSLIYVPVFLLAISLIKFIYTFFTPPTLPRNIPTIPFYVSLLPFFFDVDQSITYKTYLEQALVAHGAVKLFFGGRWNILVTRPSYISEVLKNEDVFQKAGNQVKIPHSVLAEYTGENVISAHGDSWRLYKGVVKPGLQRAFETDVVQRNARKLCELLREEQRGRIAEEGVLVADLLQRYALANLSEVVLQSDFKTLEDPKAPLHILQLAVKREIFNPIFMNFPFLDRLPIPSRKRARNLVRNIQDTLLSTILASHSNHICTEETDKLGCRLIAAWKQGLLTEKQFRHNSTAIFLAGQENPQLLMTSLIYLLGKHPDAQSHLRDEISTAFPDASEPITPEQLQSLPFLTSIIYEALRLYPPISQLINRRTSQPILLSSSAASSTASSHPIVIPANTYVGYSCYATSRDPSAWGPDAEEFRPERWGRSSEEIAKTWRRRVARGECIAFHGGRRACLGERFAMLEIRVTVVELIRALEWVVDPRWKEAMTPAGPLYPRALKIQFRSVEKDV